jgi:hypothetical protein
LFEIDIITSSYNAKNFYAKLDEGLISRAVLLLELLPDFTVDEIELFIFCAPLCTSLCASLNSI